MRIGIVGEDPHDTQSIVHLLSHKYDYNFKTILKRVHGKQLDSPKTKRLLSIELESAPYEAVIFSRDLDGFPSELKKVKKIHAWFNHLSQAHSSRSFLLLFVYELEALILADISTFNRLYHTSIQYKKNPEQQKNPKEFLKQKTRKARRTYQESDCPELFQQLDVRMIEKKCSHFKKFVTAFEAWIEHE